MEYLLPSILIVTSYLLGSFFAFQVLRSPIDRPLIYSNNSLILILTILFGWIPFGISLYLAYRNASLFFVIILILARFFILPTMFNEKFKKFMDQKGI